MLQSIIAKNFIIADNLNVDFAAGLNVLSGETGAGKSVLVGVLNYAFGATINQDILKDNTQPAFLEVCFRLNEKQEALMELLRRNEIEPEDNELFFAREISPQLRNRHFINGRRVTIQIVKEFRDVLLDFHSQRDQLLLLNKDYQLEVLDSYGGLQSLAADYKKNYQKMLTLSKELKQAQEEEQVLREKTALYEYQLDEIEKLSPSETEFNSLQNELNLLNNQTDIMLLTEEIDYLVFSSEQSVYDKLLKFGNKLEKYSEFHPGISAAKEKINDACSFLYDAGTLVRDLKEEITVDSERLSEIEERFNALNTLMAKYRTNIGGVLVHAQEVKTFLKKRNSQKEKVEQLAAELKKTKVITLNLAGELTQKREETAVSLADAIVQNLRLLALKDAEFCITVRQKEQKKQLDFLELEKDSLTNVEILGQNGQDEIEFLFSANLGQSPQPIKSVISGGELSRLLLTLKKVTAEKEANTGVRTLIFDEIDTGIGGKTADVLAKFIKDIAAHYQVLCITHLPQIAAAADNHYLIEKFSDDVRTTLNVIAITAEKRVFEIARMLSGTITEASLNHARELLGK